MKNKKLVVFALSAIGLLGLAACDEIIAKPNDYDSNLVTVEGYTGEIYNNEISVVYDSIRSGNVGSDVLNELLYSYSITTFGYYNIREAALRIGPRGNNPCSSSSVLAG